MPYEVSLPAGVMRNIEWPDSDIHCESRGGGRTTGQLADQDHQVVGKCDSCPFEYSCPKEDCIREGADG